MERETSQKDSAMQAGKAGRHRGEDNPLVYILLQHPGSLCIATPNSNTHPVPSCHRISIEPHNPTMRRLKMLEHPEGAPEPRAGAELMTGPFRRGHLPIKGSTARQAPMNHCHVIASPTVTLLPPESAATTEQNSTLTTIPHRKPILEPSPGQSPRSHCLPRSCPHVPGRVSRTARPRVPSPKKKKKKRKKKARRVDRPKIQSSMPHGMRRPKRDTALPRDGKSEPQVSQPRRVETADWAV